MLALPFAAALIPLAVTPVMPLIDYYDHLARFYVLSHLGPASPLQANYLAHWSLMPDIGLDVIATPLLALLPPLIAAHVLAVLILLMLYGGLLYFNFVLTGRTPFLAALLMAPLLYSYVWNWGFANFLLALGLAFWAAGWWLAHRNHPLKATPAAAVFALVIFLAHGVAFLLYGIMLGLLEIGLALQQRPLEWRVLAGRLALLLLQAVIPVLLFLQWQHGRGDDGTGVSQSGFALHNYVQGLTFRPGHMGLRRLQTILRVEEGPSYWFDAVTLILQALAVGFLVWRRQLAFVRPAWLLAAAAVLMIALVPSKMFGVDYIADRMPLFAVLVLLGAMSATGVALDARARIAIALLALIAIARIGAIAYDWHGYGARYREFQSAASHLPRGALTLEIPIGAGRHETNIPRCEMYRGLLVTQFGQMVPLFAFNGQHPIRLAGRLKQSAEFLRNNPVTVREKIDDYGEYMKTAAPTGLDYFLLCNSQLLGAPVPANFPLVTRTPHFTLVRVHG